MEPKPTICAASNRGARTSVLTTVAALALAVALAACRGGAAPAPTQTPAPGPAPTVPTSPARQASPTPVQSQMTLYIWVSSEFAFAAQPDNAALLQGFAEAYPGIRVHVSVKETYGKGGMVDLLAGASRVAPAYLPDLILLDEDSLEQVAALGLVQPVDVLAPSVRGALFANVQAAGSGVPFAMDFPLLVYRTPMTLPLPLTLGAIAESGGRYAFAVGDEDAAVRSLLAQYVGLGGALVDEEGKAALDSRLLARVLEAYRGLADQGVLAPQVLSLDRDEVWDLYRAGGADFAEVWASQVWGHPSALADADLAALPTADGRPIALARVWSWAIVSPTPERQQAAVQFLAWVLQVGPQSAWCEAAHLVPTQAGAWPLAGLSAAHSEFLLGMAQAATPCPSTLRTPAVASALHTALSQVLKGQLAPRQAAEQALNKIRQQ
ncbi:MAG: extracellular solute-binding protein [Chloroflexi bacterium]|nr:extracellular solute-binding protein [Chloroflexota bacterium]